MELKRENSLNPKNTSPVQNIFSQSAKRDTYNRRTVSDQGPQQHLWAHQWWNRRGQKRSSPPSSGSTTSGYPKVTLFLRSRRSWPVEPRYKRR